MQNITRRSALRGAAAIGIAGVASVATGGVIAAPARELTAREAVDEFVEAYGLLLSRLKMCQTPREVRTQAIVSAVLIERMEAHAHDNADRDAIANIERLSGEPFPEAREYGDRRQGGAAS